MMGRFYRMFFTVLLPDRRNSSNPIPKALIFLTALFTISTTVFAQPTNLWEFSRNINISATPVDGFQIKVTLNGVSQHEYMKADGSDLRFYAGAQQCNYWIERFNKNGESVIWVKVPSASTTALTMYYGNPAATAVSNGEATFEFFDGFSGSELSNKWTNISNSGSVTVSGGEVVLENKGDLTSIYSKYDTTILDDSYIMELKHKETGYYRNRYYVTDEIRNRPQTTPDGIEYGLWSDTEHGNETGYVQWGGGTVFANNDYLMRWDITRSTGFYQWSNYNYQSGNQISIANRVFPGVTFLNISVTEQTYRSTYVDWVRIRKSGTAEVISIDDPIVRLPTPIINTIYPITGCEGQNFTISGKFPTNFGRIVKLNGSTPLVIVSQDSVSITAKFGATSGNITVTTTAGKSAETFSITPTPLPVVHPGDSLAFICSNGTSAPLGGFVDIDNGVWTVNIPGGYFTLVGTDYKKTTWTAPAGFSGKAIFTLTGTNGTCTATASKSMMVHETPSVVVQVSGTEKKFCVGEAITFTAPDGYTGYTYLVTQGANTSTLENGSNPVRVISNLQPGAIVKVKVDNFGCSATLNTEVFEVYTIPSGALMISETSGKTNNDGIICSNDAVSFSFNSAVTYSKYTFILNGTTVLYSGPNASLLNIDTLKDGDKVSVVVENEGKCSKTFGPVTISVKNNPTGGLSPLNPEICQGNTITFTASYGFEKYEFILNDNSTLQGPSPTRTYISGTNLLNNDKVSVRVEDENKCSAVIGSVIVKVNALPAKPSISTGGQATTFCVGDGRKIILSAPNDPSYTYQWYKETGTYGSGTPTIQLDQVSESGNYSVSFRDGKGCLSPKSDPINITIHPKAPTPTITVNGPLEFCEGGNVQLTSSSAETYQWYYGETSGSLNPIPGETNQTITISGILKAGYYAVGITNAEDCAGSSLSAVRQVIINALPDKPEITVTGNLILCEGENVQLSAPNAFSYQWFMDGAPIPGPLGKLKDYSTNSPGEYTVQIANVHGCLSLVSDGETVVVKPLPEPTINGPGTICLGTPLNGYKTESDMSKYQWQISGGTIDAGQNSDSVTVSWSSTGGQKSLNVIYTNEDGCTSNKQASFQNSPPVKPVILGIKEVCVGATEMVYTTDSANGQTDYIWTISPGGTITSGGGSLNPYVIVTWIGAGAQYVTVNYNNENNCKAALPTNFYVTVNPLPNGDLSENIAVCEDGISPKITFTGSAGNAPYTFSYFINDGTNDGPQNNITTTSGNSVQLTHSTMTPGVYTYHLTGISDNKSCLQSITNKQTVITVTKKPAASFTYGNKYFCRDGVNPAPVITGTTGGKFSATPSGLIINENTGAIDLQVSIAKGYQITYTIAASGGCATFTYSDSVYLTSKPVITEFKYGQTSYCKSGNILYTPTLTGQNAFKEGTFSSSPGLYIHDAKKGTIDPAQSDPGNYVVLYTVPASAGCGEVTATYSITITEVPAATISYSGSPVCKTGTNLPVTLSGTGAYTGGTYTFTPAGLTISTNGTINPSTSIPGTYTITYTIPASGGCVAVPVSTTVTISPKPEVSAGIDITTCIDGGPINITQGANTNHVSSILWSGGTGEWTQANSLTEATYTPASGEIGEVILTLTAQGTSGCAGTSTTSTKKLTINSLPDPVIIIPESSPSICIGGIQSFISVKEKVTVFTIGPLNSSTTPIDIPDNETKGVSKSINVSGIPSNAVITSVGINFTVSHTFNGDLTINLKGANGKVLNISNSLTGPGFNNTRISSSATNPIQTSGDMGPYTGSYAAQMRYGTQGATSVPGNRAFARSFDELFSKPNGDWVLSVRDGGTGDYGKFNSWSITINYSIPIDSVPVYWSTTNNSIPDNLFEDASATVPYTGDARAVVYAKATKVGENNFIATSVAQNGCKATGGFTLNVNPSPQVYIRADYCENAQNGKITLKAMGVDNALKYSWSTGETTSSVLVDIAKEYYVSVTNAQGCTGTGILSVAEELVVNGDFEQGNVGFYSEYIHMTSPDPPHPLTPDNGLVNEGTYAIDTSAYIYHAQFHGRDHTTSEQKGKFMMINGKSDMVRTERYPESHRRIVWEQIVSVLPNTDYYFSAWAMNFSGLGTSTRLQFEVNGMPVGTIADLSQIPSPSSEEEISIDNWVRFYNGNTNGVDNTWNSGNVTDAIIRIVNLSNEGGGNDFGLDDISFGTLAPFVSGPDVGGRSEQTICVGESIQPIVYKVGSGDEPVDQLPSSYFTKTFDGLNYTITGGSLAVPGVYDYALTTTGNCPIPSSASGKITVIANSNISLNSASPDATLCFDTNLPSSINYTLGGTVDGAEFIGLPPGMTGVYNSHSKVASISGSANAVGTFEYKVKTSSVCKKDSLSGVIQVDALPIAGTITSPVVCLHEDGIVKVTGYSGTILNWASSEDGVNYTTISNTSETQAFTNITQNRYYKVSVGNGVCPAATTSETPVRIQNLWEGKLSNDFNNPFNWASSNVPVLNTAVCGGVVTIPNVVYNDPILTSSASLNHLNVLSGANLTINKGGNLQVAGNITNSGIINAKNGGIEYIGSTARTIESNIFLNNAIGDLKINNDHLDGVTLNAPIDIFRSLTFGSKGTKLITNDQLTLKSTKEETASLGNMTGKTIIGKATVERFINTGLEAQGGHRKSWQLLAISTIGQTIKQSWMENATAPTGMPGGDPKPGYGIMITGRLPNAVAEGFDVRTTPGASIKAYNSSTGTYDEPNSTHLPIYDPRGYMVMVRGDRSVFTHNGDAKPTTLRTKGNFIIGDHSVDVPANSFASIGNPYASAIEINKIVKTGGVTEVIAFWDPLLSGGYGLGGFVYLAKTGDHYIATPLTGSYSGPVKHIQSGQAFFVQTNAAGKVSFAENAKVSGSELVMRQENRDSRTVLFKTNLYGINPDGTAFIADGTLMQLGDEFSNEIDRYDAIKMSNTSENLSIRSGGKNIAVERRQHVNDFDTIFYNLTGVRAQKYRLSFIAQDMQRQGLDAFLEDIYLGTKTPINLNGSTDYDFTIENIPGSYASDRFRIVFHAAFGPLSVTFISVNATESEGDIQVKWKVENENGIQAYKVEKSSDGLSFYEVAQINAGNLNEYNWTDKNAYTGNNYYRINSIGLNGKDEISRTVKVLIQADPSKISIYPNPITNGVVNVHLSNQPSGKYSIRLLNPAGQIIVHKVVTHIQGNSSHAIKWDYKMARGMYQIEVTKPDGLVHMIKVVY